MCSSENTSDHRCQEQHNRRGGKRGREDPVRPPAPCFPHRPPHSAAFIPHFLAKEPGIFQGQGAMGRAGGRATTTAVSIRKTLAVAHIGLLRPSPGTKGGDLSPSPAASPVLHGSASQDRRHKGTQELLVTFGSLSCGTSPPAPLVCHPCPVPAPEAPQASPSGVTHRAGAHGTLYPSPGGGVAVRNEKRGPGRCPALF